MLVSESTVTVLATPPLKETALAPVKLIPVRSTEVPDTPLVGANELITGAGTKLVPLVPTPVEVVMVIGPMVALVGTWTVTDVAVHGGTTVASVPLNLTVLVPWLPPKFVPVMVTEVPTAPPPGVNEVIVGGGRTVKLVPLVAVPPGVVTVRVPVAAPLGTVVLM